MRIGCEFSTRPREKSNEKEMKKGNWRGVKLPNYLNMFPTPKAFQDGTTPEKMEELEKENPKYFKARMQHLSTRLRYEEHQKDQEKITKYPTPVASNIQSPQLRTEWRGISRGGLFEEEEQTELDLWGEASRCSELPRTFKVPKFQILEDEPDVGRVANGDALVLDRYKDRIQGLGNGVLPQIPYIIGRRLKEIYDYEQS